jgi:hypothetical protein
MPNAEPTGLQDNVIAVPDSELVSGVDRLGNSVHATILVVVPLINTFLELSLAGGTCTSLAPIDRIWRILSKF